MAASLAGCGRSNTAPTSADAVAALEYLSQRAGVTSHVVEGNCVFVIFPEPPPQDWKPILDDAALAGNKATGGEFIAAGISGGSENWRAFADSRTIGIATARDSKVVQ